MAVFVVVAVFVLSQSLVLVVDSVEVCSVIFVVLGSFEVIRCSLCGSGHC